MKVMSKPRKSGDTWLARSVEPETLDRRVVRLIPMWGVEIKQINYDIPKYFLK